MVHFSSSVSPKGQVTIPLEIRRRFGVKAKDRVTFTVEGETIRIVPMRSVVDAINRSVPALAQPRNWEEIENIAHDEHARHVASEGLDPSGASA